MLKCRELEIFRRTKLAYYKREVELHPCNYFKRYKKIEALLKRKAQKKNHINVKNPPLGLVKEMILNGEYKECPKGYIYVEYQGYKAYLHTLVVLNNGIIIPKGYGVHHIDKNKKNNDIKNLKVVSWEEHMKLHNQKAV
jgi:hypothetical protein